MKYRLLNYLACPYCKDQGFPLKLIVIEERRYEERKLPEKASKPLCDLYCAYRGAFIKDLGDPQNIPCEECIKIEIVTGVLFCPRCMRWYPIIDEIPRVLPDQYRKPDEDTSFLRKYENYIPEEIKRMGRPYNLSQSA